MSNLKFIVPTRDGGKIHVLYYSATEKDRPLLIEVHGGGFIGGTAEDDRPLCEILNCELNYNIASIDYRHAPEKVFPTASFDLADAVSWLLANKDLSFDSHRLYAIGHSAGACLVAGLPLLLPNVSFNKLLLDYPYLDIALDPSKRPYVLYSLPRSLFRKYAELYFPDVSRRKESLADPLFMSSSELVHYPPTLILTCHFDSLRQDGRRFAERLKMANVPVEIHELKRAVHGVVELVPNGVWKKQIWLVPSLYFAQPSQFKKALFYIKSFLVN